MSDPNNIYDDTDPAFIYQPTDGFWGAVTWNASSVQKSGTMHVTNDLAANVTFTFPVAAIGFSYFGIKRSRGGLYGICIDCTPGAPNFIPVDGFNATDNGANPPVLLYQHFFAAPSIHQIIIRNMADPRGMPVGNSELAIDRIELNVTTAPFALSSAPTPTPTLTASSISSTPFASLSSTSTHIASLTSTSTPSSPPAPSMTTLASPAHPAPRLAIIVSAVLGALALVCGIFILLFWRRHHRPWMTPFMQHWSSGSAPATPVAIGPTPSEDRFDAELPPPYDDVP